MIVVNLTLGRRFLEGYGISQNRLATKVGVEFYMFHYWFK